MDDFECVHSLDEKGIEQLWQLFQQEWWTKGRSRQETAAMLHHCDEIIAFLDGKSNLAGFARVITDYMFKALVLDIIVAKPYRGLGLGKLLIDALIEHPPLADVAHFELYCLPEMVPLYRKWGFTNALGRLQFMRREHTG